MTSPLHLVTQQLDPAALRARVTGRSWWAVRFHGGKIITEWQRDWLDVPKKGRQSIRLYCPNGQVAELGNDGGDATDRIFQFKRAFAQVSIGAGGSGRGTSAHVIGMIHGTDGQCTCWRWDYFMHRLVKWEDNANHMLWDHVGRLENAVLGIKAD